MVLRHFMVGLCVLGITACGPDNTNDTNNNNQNLCDGVQCGTNAHCVSTSGDCQCDAGFAGDPVQGCTAEGSCETDSCTGHGTCDDSTGTPVCTCDTGWAGTACDGCDTDYDLVGEDCVSSQLVDCADITPPANSTQVEGQVTITYTTAGGWTSPADCAFACNSDYDLVGGACVNEQLVDCTDITPPANAHQVEAQVTVTYTTAGGWTTPADCAWECNTDYDLVGGSCINSQQVDCTVITPPANSTLVTSQVTITYTTAGGWTTGADCGFACNTDYDQVGGACVSSQLVDCADITPPANAHQVEGQVTITYTTAGGWTTPADCGFACNTDYDLVGGSCINSQLVACASITPPANAHQVDGQVTITYSTAAGWTDPAYCTWDCDAGFHRDGDVCIENVVVQWCTVQWPFPGYTTSATLTETIYGQIYSTTGVGTSANEALPGVLSQLCYSDTVPAYPTDLSAMTCLDATYNLDVGNNDEYRADLTINVPGTYYYVYAFSGDGGGSWTVCDASGLEGDPVEPGVAVIDDGDDCDVSGWTLRQANSSIDYVFPAGTIIPAGGTLVVARNATQAAFEQFWGEVMSDDVLYINSTGAMPMINGAETYTLLDASSTVIDGPTVAIAVGQSIRRTSTGPAGDAASWTVVADTEGAPGDPDLEMSGAFVLISEFSDASGTGNYIYEFVELSCDNP